MKWKTEDILKMMDNRRENRNKKGKYKQLNKEIKIICQETKKALMEKKSNEIETGPCFESTKNVQKNRRNKQQK